MSRPKPKKKISAEDKAVAAAARAPGRPAFDPSMAMLRQAVLANDPEFQRYGLGSGQFLSLGTVDYLFGSHQDAYDPQAVFDRLRWGGQFVFVGSESRQVEAELQRYLQRGFVVETKPSALWFGPRFLGFRIPGFGRVIHYFIVRKVRLVMPGQFSDRFTYDVQLEKGLADGEPYVVVKRVPTIEDLIERLSQRFPEATDDVLRDRARKMNETIFPVFLTRETAFLKILARDLPEEDRPRVPRVLEMRKDKRGMASEIRLNWLRKTVQPMSQLEFALQSARLLQHLHERAQMIHLDLRLDNFVVSRYGVGFVDYGSAARVGEDIAASPLLSHLFTEIMRTSQIQRMLDRMSSDGRVTSEIITGARKQVDPAIDLFYLAVQIDKPHSNPYMHEIVQYEPQSRQARLITELTQQVLRPRDAQNPVYRSAADLVRGLNAVQEELAKAET